MNANGNNGHEELGKGSRNRIWMTKERVTNLTQRTRRDRTMANDKN